MDQDGREAEARVSTCVSTRSPLEAVLASPPQEKVWWTAGWEMGEQEGRRLAVTTELPLGWV